MDDELFQHLQGYLHWAQDVHAQRLSQSHEKIKYFEQRSYDALRALLTQRTVPLHKQRIEQTPKILEVLYKATAVFDGFHSAEILQRLTQQLEDAHLVHLALHDTISQQAKILRAVHEQDPAFLPVSFHEVHPTLRHLHQLECEKEARAKAFVGSAKQSLHEFLTLLHTSHQRLNRIATHPEFLQDSRVLYKAAYTIGLCVLFFSNQYNLHDKEIPILLNTFWQKIAGDPAPLPSESLETIPVVSKEEHL